MLLKRLKINLRKKGGFLGMLLGILVASLLGDMLIGKGILRTGYGNKEGKEFLRAGYGCSIKKRLIPTHPLTNFEMQYYYHNEQRFNEVYSRDNLSKTIKNGAYVINVDKYADVGTHWIALYVEDIEIIYFDSFGWTCS